VVAPPGTCRTGGGAGGGGAGAPGGENHDAPLNAPPPTAV